MNIKTFLDTDRILLGFTAENQKTALEKLVSPLVKGGFVTDSEVFLNDLQRREDEITTVIDNGVAMPHARSHSVNRLVLAVGLANEEGIQFGPNDETECRLIFCIGIPHFAPTSHLPLLQLLAKLSHDPKRVDKILSYKTATGVINFLTAFKG